METQRKNIHLTEWILILSGIFILASVLFLFETQDFTLWVAAKVLYGISVILFIFKY